MLRRLTASVIITAAFLNGILAFNEQTNCACRSPVTLTLNPAWGTIGHSRTIVCALSYSSALLSHDCADPMAGKMNTHFDSKIMNR